MRPPKSQGVPPGVIHCAPNRNGHGREWAVTTTFNSCSGPLRGVYLHDHGKVGRPSRPRDPVVVRKRQAGLFSGPLQPARGARRPPAHHVRERRLGAEQRSGGRTLLTVVTHHGRTQCRGTAVDSWASAVQAQPLTVGLAQAQHGRTSESRRGNTPLREEEATPRSEAGLLLLGL